MLGFIVGLIVGACCGVLILGLMVMAGEADEWAERAHEELRADGSDA